MFDTNKKFSDLDREERLGVYFVHFDIHNRFNITFETFLDMVNSGAWEPFIAERQERVRVLT